VLLASGARTFDATDQPGVYSMQTHDGPVNFAVNLDPSESQTSTLPAETLEQLGARLVGRTAVAENNQRQQLLRDVQLESRQKLWQWLIVAALGVLVAETWLAGRTTKHALAKTVSA
jgi:hypothetical protein